ncbi:MAG: alpha/beta fold hydrolase, partial [Longimicrobiales bacterium]
VRNWPDWEQARDEYKKIALPVFLLYGDDDWSRETEREANRRIIPQVRIRFIEHAGHFLALDAPADFEKAIVDYTQWLRGQANGGGRSARARAEAPNTWMQQRAGLESVPGPG